MSCLPKEIKKTHVWFDKGNKFNLDMKINLSALKQKESKEENKARKV